MKGTWFEVLRDRWRSTWDVFLGRAYAAYSVPDAMSEVRLRIALSDLLRYGDDHNWGYMPEGEAVSRARAELEEEPRA